MSKQEQRTPSRRDFLGKSVATLLALGFGCSPKHAKGGSHTPDSNSGGNNSTIIPAQALVGIVRDADVAKAVTDAIAIVGGLPNLSGKTVLLKPNLVCTNRSPYTTGADVIGALISLAKANGSSRVIVADRSEGRWKTVDAFAASGISAVAMQLGAELVDLGNGTFSNLKPRGATSWNNGIAYSDVVRTGIDYLINVPCCKHHLLTNYTAAIKNWMGIIGQSSLDGRGWAHDGLASRLPELHLGVREHLVIMDATQIALSNGPIGPGAQASPGIIVASTDPLAVDVTAVCLLKHYLRVANITNKDIDPYTPWEQPQIEHGMTLGIGMRARDGFKYSSQGIDEISAIMTYANTTA